MSIGGRMNGVEEIVSTRFVNVHRGMTKADVERLLVDTVVLGHCDCDYRSHIVCHECDFKTWIDPSDPFKKESEEKFEDDGEHKTRKTRTLSVVSGHTVLRWLCSEAIRVGLRIICPKSSNGTVPATFKSIQCRDDEIQDVLNSISDLDLNCRLAPSVVCELGVILNSYGRDHSKLRAISNYDFVDDNLFEMGSDRLIESTPNRGIGGEFEFNLSFRRPDELDALKYPSILHGRSDWCDVRSGNIAEYKFISGRMGISEKMQIACYAQMLSASIGKRVTGVLVNGKTGEVIRLTVGPEESTASLVRIFSKLESY